MGNLKLRICTQGSRYENRKAEEEYFMFFLKAVLGNFLFEVNIAALLQISSCANINHLKGITAV